MLVLDWYRVKVFEHARILIKFDSDRDYPVCECFDALMIVLFLFVRDRAEKEKAQYFGELNDMRASVDHLANEKVFSAKRRCCFGCRWSFSNLIWYLICNYLTVIFY